MKIHYLEIVTSDVDALCSTYARVHAVTFGEPDAVLGNAKTAQLEDGTIIGVRATMSAEEQSVVRSYFLVNDIQEALEFALEQGAEVAHPATELPGKGWFAIYTQAGIQHGLWQL